MFSLHPGGGYGLIYCHTYAFVWSLIALMGSLYTGSHCVTAAVLKGAAELACGFIRHSFIKPFPSIGPAQQDFGAEQECTCIWGNRPFRLAFNASYNGNLKCPISILDYTQLKGSRF